jgi:hypothetical protein
MSTLAAPSPPTDLRALRSGLDAGDERAIEEAFAGLSRGTDPHTLLALVKALLGIGLPTLAETLLTTIGRPLLAEPSLAALASRLSAMTHDRVPAAEQKRAAASNLAALRARGFESETVPDLAASLESQRLVILRDRRGRTHTLVRDREGALRLVGPLRFAAPPAEVAAIRALTVANIAVVGLPPPRILDELLATPNASAAPTRIIAVEGDALALAAWLRCGDASEAILKGAVVLRFGAAGVAAELHAIDETVAAPPIARLLLWRPELAALGAPLRPEATLARWQATTLRLKSGATQRYAHRDAAWFRDRFAAARRGETRLCIAALASRHTTVVGHMARDLLTAFAALGHETIALREPDPSLPLIDSVRPFAEGDIDLVVTFNYLARYPQRRLPVDLPFVCWLQDAVASAQTREAGASQGPLDLLVAHSGGYYESRFGYPRGQSIDAPNLTSWSTYGSIGESRRAPGGFDVVYIGHGSESAETVAERNGATAEVRALLREAALRFDAMLRSGRTPTGFERLRMAADLLAHAGLVCGSAGPAFYFATLAVYDRLFRHQALEWAASWARSRGRRFAIFGRGWDSHPTLAPFAAGEIANGRALGELCRDAGVVLHANGNASLHQRLLDGLAAGGCVLTRRNPADEVPGFHRRLVALGRSRGIDSLAALIESPEAQDAIAGLERTLGCVVRPAGDALRDADLAVLRRVPLWPEETLTDDGFLAHLLSERGLFTPHGAADIDGFAESTYGTEEELHALLDRMCDSEDERERLRLPMRASVRERFTMEWLAAAIIERMAAQLERAAG